MSDEALRPGVGGESDECHAHGPPFDRRSLRAVRCSCPAGSAPLSVRLCRTRRSRMAWLVARFSTVAGPLEPARIGRRRLEGKAVGAPSPALRRAALQRPLEVAEHDLGRASGRRRRRMSCHRRAAGSTGPHHDVPDGGDRDGGIRWGGADSCRRQRLWTALPPGPGMLAGGCWTLPSPPVSCTTGQRRPLRNYGDGARTQRRRRTLAADRLVAVDR